MDIVPLQPSISEEHDVEYCDLDGARRLKRLKSDSQLPEYYSQDGTYSGREVVQVAESDQLDSPFLEKKIENVEEPAYQMLAYELGCCPEPLAVRTDEDGNMFLWMDFLEDYGPVEDLDYDGLPDFLDYVESIAEACSPLWAAGIQHNDLVRTEQKSGDKWQGTQYVANVLTAGSEDDAKVIDMEYSQFEDLNHYPHKILANIRSSAEEEADDVMRATQHEVLRSLEGAISENILGRELNKNDALILKGGNYELKPTEEVGPELSEILQDVRIAFEEGKRRGIPSTQELYENARLSKIDTKIESTDIQTKSMRRFEEILDFIDRNLN